MILYLYGMPGAGKNYIGEILKKKYDFFFQDADQYLTKEMKEKLKNGQHFTIKEVEYYHEIIAYKLIQLKLKYKNIVVSQASLLQKYLQKNENDYEINNNLNTEEQDIVKQIESIFKK